MSDLTVLVESDHQEWIDFLKVSIEPMDSVASWRNIKKCNITCKERLKNITWRKYYEREKYSLKMLDQGLKSPSTMHIYFSRGFLNGPITKMNGERRIEPCKVKFKKKRLLSQRPIRFKEMVDFRSYGSQEDTLVAIPDLETFSYSNHNFGFTEGKERIKNSKRGISSIQKFLRNLSCKIKSIVIEFFKRKDGGLEIQNIPWEPTLLLEKNPLPSFKVKDTGIFRQLLNNIYSYSGKQFKTTVGALYRIIQKITLWTAERIHRICGFVQKLSASFKKTMTAYVLTIGNLYTAITDIIRQLLSIVHYILVIIYRFALYLYQRAKKRILRSVILTFYVIRRAVSWKKSLVISDLPTEIKWEILKHLDYKSASRFCRVLNIGELNCLQYHQFLIPPQVKAPEFGIISCVFTMIGWLFYQPPGEFLTEVDIWTVSYFIEKMIGSDKNKFSVLFRNAKFRHYVGDEILLALACKYGEYSIFCKLISDSKNDPSIGVDSAIRWAASRGHAEIVKLLLKDERVDPSIDNNKPLISACEYGHVDVVDALLKQSKIDPALQSNRAIVQACYYGRIEVVRRLLKDPRVDPTVSENRCLKLACNRNHQDIVTILVNDSRIHLGHDEYKFIQRLYQRQNKKKYAITCLNESFDCSLLWNT